MVVAMEEVAELTYASGLTTIVCTHIGLTNSTHRLSTPQRPASQ